MRYVVQNGKVYISAEDLQSWLERASNIFPSAGSKELLKSVRNCIVRWELDALRKKMRNGI